MNCIKTVLTGLVGVSLCMANISGFVTDTGTTPISGAVVRLENSGQMVTTGADGSFTLTVSTAILSGDSKLRVNGLFARISGNLMTVTLTKRSAVEVTTFDLSGKAVMTLRKTLDAGCHSVSLPYRGDGIYLYKVKSGNSECVLKGNSVGGISSGSALSYQGSSLNTLAKLVKNAATFNDVIAVTKSGYLNYREVAYNSDTAGVQIMMVASAGTVTDGDGNVYQTVKIGKQVWMAENLRTTKYSDNSAITFDTSTVTWAADPTPKYCFYNNTTNSDSIKKYGALYNWYVVSSANPKNIAPAGWHVPTDGEWDTLKNYLVANEYNWDSSTTDNSIAKSLAVKTDWDTYSITGTIGCDLTKNNRSGFSSLPSGYRLSLGTFKYQRSACNWWSTTQESASLAWSRYLGYDVDFTYRSTYSKNNGFSVRLVKD